MNIELKFTITNDKEFTDIYNACMSTFYLSNNQLGSSIGFYKSIIDQMSPHIESHGNEEFITALKSLTKHPENEVHYHMGKILDHTKNAINPKSDV